MCPVVEGSKLITACLGKQFDDRGEYDYTVACALTLNDRLKNFTRNSAFVAISSRSFNSCQKK